MRITVAIPVRNEAASIGILLNDLKEQTKQPDEIVIVDSGSTDETVEIVNGFAQAGLPIKLFRESQIFPGRARNIAAANATHDWIAFTDAGTRRTREWLARLTEKVSDGVQVVYGTYAPIVDTIFKECAAIAYVPPLRTTEEGSVRPPSVVSLLLQKKVWQQAGGFPENLRSAEDLLFIKRLESEAFRIVRAPQAIVYWDVQPGPWSTFKRFTVYSRNNIRAGLWRDWQRPVLERYAVLVLLCLPAIYFGWRWFVVPLAGWLALLAVRALRALRANRKSYPAPVWRNAVRLLLLVELLALLDSATLCGSMIWLIRDKVSGEYRRRK